MSYDAAIELIGVWKRYSTKAIFHGSLREDIVNMFKRNNDSSELRTDEFWALRDVRMHVKRGECIGLYGPNGSGKTTILKLISSVTYPNKGRVIVRGSVAPLISIGVGFHPDLTGRENIYMNGTILGMTIDEVRSRLDEIVEFSELEGRFIDMPVKKYSAGMYLRLGFSIAAHSPSDILLIDELLAVGDQAYREKCIERIQSFRGVRTIIIVLHDLELLERVTDRIAFIRNGEIVESPLDAGESPLTV